MKIDSEGWLQTVIDGARRLGVAVSLDQARRMQAHARELLLWNRSTNLTAITDPREVALKHYVDALAVVPWVGKAARVLDAGSGGGFPGIPLKIVRSDLAVCMVDSVRKKVSFLKHAVRTLGLNGTDAVHARLEQLGEQQDYRGQFDLVVCRAFSSLENFIGLTSAFLAPGGSLLALKGPQADHAHEAADREHGGAIRFGDASYTINIMRYRLPLLDSRRRLVRFTPLAED